MHSKRNFGLALLLSVIAATLSARLSIAWPYVENWPYTGLAYGAFFLLVSIGVFGIFRENLISPASRLTWKGIGSTLVLVFFACSSFWAFSLRFLTEPGIACAFEMATVTGKTRSSNHNYPCLHLRTDKGKELVLDMPGQDALWQAARIGSKVKKRFGEQELELLSAGDGTGSDVRRRTSEAE